MKKLLYSLSLLALLATVSCKDDDSPAPIPANAVSFNGKIFKPNTALVGDLGPSYMTMEDDPSHYTNIFILTDATEENPKASFMLMSFMFSLGSENFTTGTFNWFNYEEYDIADIEDKSVYMLYMVVDGNNDGDIEDVDTGKDFEYEATAGKVTIAGAGASKYTITYDVTFAGGKTLKGTYTGEFTDMGPIEEENERIAAPRRRLR